MTFLTTNFAERLDPALLRPGRIDYILHFDYASKD
jgi:ATP-dependent 26S proteasome regulatory subunit